MDDILSSQVHEHIFGPSSTWGKGGSSSLNGPRRLLAENLEHQQMELTTEDREDHTFNGTRHLSLSLFLYRRRALLCRRRSRRKKKNSRTPPLPPSPGIFFDVEAATSVPLQYIEIQSVFVRGMLGKMTVWTSDSGESEKKYWKRTSKETIVDEETGEENRIFLIVFLFYN